MESLTSKYKWKLDHKQGICTGKSSQCAIEVDDWVGSSQRLADRLMLSSQDHLPQMSMFGKKTHEWMEPNLNLGASPSSATPSEIGIRSCPPPSPEIWMVSTLPWSFVILVPCLESARNTLNLLLSSDLLLSSGVEVDLVSLGELGKKPVLTLTLKIPAPNSGTAIAVKGMLSSTSFEEVSTLHIYYDGATVIQSLWKSKDLVQF